MFATGHLDIPADQPLLETEIYIKALITARATIAMVVQTAEHIEEDRPKATGWLKAVIEAMDKPEGHLDALDIAFEHFNARYAAERD